MLNVGMRVPGNANALLAGTVTAMGTHHALGEGIRRLEHARTRCAKEEVRMAEPPFDKCCREEVPHTRLLRDTLERLS